MIFNENPPEGGKTNSPIIFNFHYSTSTTITNVTEVEYQDENNVKPIEYWDFYDLHHTESLLNYDTIPTFLSQCDLISLPVGVKRAVERLPLKVLNKIDQDKKIAIEKCLLFASNCTSTLFHDDLEGKWKNLSSKFLHEQVKKGNDNTFIYKNVIKALCYKTNTTLPILEIRTNYYGNPSYLADEYSIQYRYQESFRNTNLMTYELKNPDSIQKRRKYYLQKLNEAFKNPIAYNLINLYPKIELPTEAEILNIGKQLAKNNCKTRKGKIIASLNKRKKETIKDYENKSFIEDALKRFNYLTSKGFIIPTKGSYKSGGRVADSFNLMNSWIRSTIKIEGENTSTLDYKAFHPNLAIKIYGGKTKYLTHQQIADYLNKDVKEVKIEHLSFFNKHPNDMKKSILFEYYSKNEPEMLDRIIHDKKMNGYKITSIKMFQSEVTIMQKCIIKLNKKDIYVGYVYDALFCKKSQKDEVLKVMNSVLMELEVYTIACEE